MYGHRKRISLPSLTHTMIKRIFKEKRTKVFNRKVRKGLRKARKKKGLKARKAESMVQSTMNQNEQ
ncbi:hypothetical protein B0A71_22100 [Flavobacterium tructae]|uniref:Uncharacterized protein n=1 Tax=Flavobacterium tructae TaxID=1114873 RepID=A0ABX4D0Q8_9FLAO|nr:hypothetical protein B0A71_22100 [Flavobacterium tructae]